MRSSSMFIFAALVVSLSGCDEDIISTHAPSRPYAEASATLVRENVILEPDTQERPGRAMATDSTIVHQ